MRPPHTWFMPKEPGRAIDPPGGACEHLEGDLHRHVVVPGPLEDLIPLADRVQRLATDDVDGADALTVVHGGFRDAVAGLDVVRADQAGVFGCEVAVLDERHHQTRGRWRHRDGLPYLAVWPQHVHHALIADLDSGGEAAARDIPRRWCPDAARDFADHTPVIANRVD